MHLVGNDTFTEALHFGHRICRSIISFNGLTSTITRLSGGFLLVDWFESNDESVVKADSVSVDVVQQNRFRGVVFGDNDAALFVVVELLSLVLTFLPASSLANGTLLPLVRVQSRLLLPASLQVGDDNSFLCSAVAVAFHLLCLIAMTFGETIFITKIEWDATVFGYQNPPKGYFKGHPTRKQ